MMYSKLTDISVIEYRLAALFVGLLMSISCMGQNRGLSISFLDIVLFSVAVPVYDYASVLPLENQITIEHSSLEQYIHQRVADLEPCTECGEYALFLGAGMIRVIYFDGACAYHTLYVDRRYTETLQLGTGVVLDGRAMKYDEELVQTISSIVNYVNDTNATNVDSLDTAIDNILSGHHYEYVPLLPSSPSK